MSYYLKYDQCEECGGDGYVWSHHENPAADSEKRQCEECERLHALEVKADIAHDISKE